MTTSTFLETILERPDDDAPRLILADWLEEHGEPERAEFIRLQVELAKLPMEDDPRKQELAIREKALLEAHEEEWLAPLREIINDWTFHRGMLGVAVDVPKFLTAAESLCRCPFIHYIDIVDHAVGKKNIESLAASPFLNRITILNLAGWYCYDSSSDLVDDEQAAILAGSPHTSHLTTLNLRCNEIDDAGVQALAASENLPRLTELDLRVNPFGDAGLVALAGASWFPQLTAIDLSYNEGRSRTDAAWHVLLAALNARQPPHLYLAGNDLTDATREAFRSRLGDRVQF